MEAKLRVRLREDVVVVAPWQVEAIPRVELCIRCLGQGQGHIGVGAEIELCEIHPAGIVAHDTNVEMAPDAALRVVVRLPVSALVVIQPLARVGREEENMLRPCFTSRGQMGNREDEATALDPAYFPRESPGYQN